MRLCRSALTKPEYIYTLAKKLTLPRLLEPILSSEDMAPEDVESEGAT